MCEKGAREPDFDTLELIADFFNVDTDYLLGRTSKTTYIPNIQHPVKDEEILVFSYRELNETNKKKSIDYTKNLLSAHLMEGQLKASHERTNMDIVEETK